jgi:hypothetical protein
MSYTLQANIKLKQDKMKVKEEFNKKLLVEGKDDQHIVFALRDKFDVEKNFDIINCESISKLIPDITIRLKSPGIECVGVIVDADVNIQNRWRSIASALSKAGFSVPSQLPKEGLIVESDDIKVGIWIMPDNNLNGIIEDFISFLVPFTDPLWPIANDTLNNIEQQNFHKYHVAHRPKALIHTWLAWQDDPGTPMGQAITKRYLTTDVEICTRFVTWLKTLFS